jgi:superfamily II DNA or RNA helicase
MSALPLRPYQVNVIEEIRTLLLAGQRRVLLYAPTGSGKTEIGIEFTRRAREKS